MMQTIEELFRKYYLEYTSYVVKDRAIPYIEDGFKPVQRRIIQTLIDLDNGTMHKVANVVGQTMKYHPHGDASIYEALVTLANANYFIERGGNFGNLLTGTKAAAARYIECRILPFAKEVLYSPEIMTYVPTYDSRYKEPVVFPAKLPVVLLQGVLGIAPGMTCKIFPHNPLEVIDCMKQAIDGKDFQIFPDLPTGGLLDVSEYDDGRGAVSIRSKIIKDEKKKSDGKAILVFTLFMAALLVFIYFGVIRQLQKIDAAEKAYNEANSELADWQEKSEELSDVEEEYNSRIEMYYTEEEVNYSNRKEIIDLISEDVLPYLDDVSVNVSSDNQISIYANQADFSTVSQVLDILKADDRIYYVNVTTSNQESTETSGYTVDAQYVITWNYEESEVN